MVRLNRNQRKVLAAVIPIDGKRGFRRAIDDGAIDLDSLGLNRDQFRRYLNELVGLGLVKPEKTEDGDKLVLLSSLGACYFQESKIEVAKAVGKYAFQFLIGTSGGLAALLVQRMLGQ